MRSGFESRHPDKTEEDFDDGLHPNAQGHRKIFEKVKDFLVENKWI